MKLLLIDDDRDLLATLTSALTEFYVIETAETGEQGEYLAQVNEYDVVIVDYSLPDLDGVKVCQKIRAAGIKIPIIMLTGNIEIANKIAAFKSGADDYVVKPFDIQELHARIEVLLRRFFQSTDHNSLTVGDLVLDLAKRKVFRAGKEISLQRKELDLLEYLMRNVGKVLTRSTIIDHIWDSAQETMTNVVDVHIKYLRDRIDRNFKHKLIKTVHGYGYKIEA